jgi:hypothetical protein
MKRDHWARYCKKEEMIGTKYPLIYNLLPDSTVEYELGRVSSKNLKKGLFPCQKLWVVVPGKLQFQFAVRILQLDRNLALICFVLQNHSSNSEHGA